MAVIASAAALLAFAAGACVGSFLNVLIDRFGTGHGPTGRSRCPSCNEQLSWQELIPIFSFIVLRGRCKHCGSNVGVHYPVAEFATGIAFLIFFTPLPTSSPSILSAVFLTSITAVLIVLFAIDLRTLTLPDVYIVLLAVLVLGLTAVRDPNPPLIMWGAIGGTLLLLVLWLVTKGRGIGFGDIKLLIPLGILLGLPGVVVMLFFAFVAGGLISVYLLLTGRATLKTAVPFGPFLIGATFVLLAWPTLPDTFFSFLLPGVQW